jgi:histidinol-phosphate/aromatic aminotransferase/cobyric acid decarboxylase-like protein
MYDCNYNPETEVLVATSGTEALYNIMMALVNPNDHVIVFEPFFPWYLPHLKMAGANVEVCVPMMAVCVDPMQTLYLDPNHHASKLCPTLGRPCQRHDIRHQDGCLQHAA